MNFPETAQAYRSIRPAITRMCFSELAQLRAVRTNYNLHPRLAILGPLEARLLDFDLVILGGLNEGKWPAQTSTDPWLSRPMRHALGLESPERRIGLSAHDFASLAASRMVLLTRSQKENGSPAVPSRWLLRLKQLASGLGLETVLSARGDLMTWAAELDRAEPVKRAVRPAPAPPLPPGRDPCRSRKSRPGFATPTRFMPSMFCACARWTPSTRSLGLQNAEARYIAQWSAS